MQEKVRATIELSAGTIEYEDTGGEGPVLVLLHGLMMDASLWDGPVADLAADHRCVVPTLPSAPIAGRCARTPIFHCPGWPVWSPSSSTVSACGMSSSSAMTPAEHSSSC